MKKLLVLTLAALTMAGLIGCKTNDKKSEGNKDSSQIQQQVEKKESEEILLAKVTKTVGNEISANLSSNIIGDLPQVEGIESGATLELDESQLAALENGGIVQMPDGSAVSIEPLEENQSSDGGMLIPDKEVEVFVNEGFDNENSEAFEGISFDAGSEDFTISPGVEIFNIMTGKEGKLSDIKEGSILNITIDKNTNTVTRVHILC